jgi:hypothetical protein
MSTLRVNKISNLNDNGPVEFTKGVEVPVGATINVGGGINVTGIVTATSFVGSGIGITTLGVPGEVNISKSIALTIIT